MFESYQQYLLQSRYLGRTVLIGSKVFVNQDKQLKIRDRKRSGWQLAGEVLGFDPKSGEVLISLNGENHLFPIKFEIPDPNLPRNLGCMNPEKIFSDKERAELLEFFYEKPRPTFWAKKFKTSAKKIIAIVGDYKNLPRNEIPFFTNFAKYKINHSFFKEINTEAKAYFLGFLMADGNIHENKMCLSLHKQDEHILHSFKNSMNSEHPIHKHKKNQVRFYVRSKQICADLIELGCTKKKSLTLELKDNIIPDDLFHHFVRGYFDGDGSISYSKKGDFLRWNWELAGTKQLLTKIQEKLDVLNLSFQEIRQFEKIFKLRVSKTKTNELKKLYDYLYQDASLFLIRKKKKMEEIFQLRQDFLDSRPNLDKYLARYDKNV